jgi:hypothetical protein
MDLYFLAIEIEWLRDGIVNDNTVLAATRHSIKHNTSVRNKSDFIRYLNNQISAENPKNKKERLFSLCHYFIDRNNPFHFESKNLRFAHLVGLAGLDGTKKSLEKQNIAPSSKGLLYSQDKQRRISAVSPR